MSPEPCRCSLSGDFSLERWRKVSATTSQRVASKSPCGGLLVGGWPTWRRPSRVLVPLRGTSRWSAMRRVEVGSESAGRSPPSGDFSLEARDHPRPRPRATPVLVPLRTARPRTDSLSGELSLEGATPGGPRLRTARRSLSGELSLEEGSTWFSVFTHGDGPVPLFGEPSLKDAKHLDRLRSRLSLSPLFGELSLEARSREASAPMLVAS